ncbi:hypothetical protein JYT28_01510, partial [Desulfobulbus sp. AH-315-M07]|nr:hypothetical protein [Desulfobulbus sp. AH-315-M07]
DAGDFSFSVDELDGFQFPTELEGAGKLALSVTVNDDTQISIPLGPWIRRQASNLNARCTSVRDCFAKLEELGEKRTDPRFGVIVGTLQADLLRSVNDGESCREFKRLARKNRALALHQGRMSLLCSFLVAKNKGNLTALKQFLAANSDLPPGMAAEAESHAFKLIERRPRAKDAKWFLKTFPRASHKRQVEDIVLSLDYAGVSASLLRCCSEELTILNLIELSRKGWTDQLIESKIASSGAWFRDFSVDEVEQLKKAGLSTGTIAALLKAAAKNRAADVATLNAAVQQAPQREYLCKGTMTGGLFGWGISSKVRLMADSLRDAERIASEEFDKGVDYCTRID